MLPLSQLPGISESERLRFYNLALEQEKLPPALPSPPFDDTRTSTRMQQLAEPHRLQYPIQETK